MRKLICTQDGKTIEVDDPVAVYGPFDKRAAEARADHFNHTSDYSGLFEPPVYDPVPQAPAFIDRANWDEHWAITRPMNDIPW